MFKPMDNGVSPLEITALAAAFIMGALSTCLFDRHHFLNIPKNEPTIQNAIKNGITEESLVSSFKQAAPDITKNLIDSLYLEETEKFCIQRKDFLSRYGIDCNLFIKNEIK